MKFALANYTLGIILLFIATATKTTAQPQAPDLKYVSIDPGTNNVEIGYYASPSASAIELEIKDVFQTSPVPKAIAIKTISGNTDGTVTLSPNDFQNYSDGAFASVINIAIDASDGNASSQSLQETHTAILCNSTFDYCKKSATIAWNNYKGFNVSVSNTFIYEQISGKQAKVVSIPDLQDTEATIDVDQTNKDACYYILSNIVDDRGNTHEVTSNKTCLSASFPKLPDFMNADYATTKSDSSIELSFTIDTATDITDYKVWHSASKDGPFEVIDSAILGKTQHPFIFQHQGNDVGKQRNFYMLVAYDECGDSILCSNMASNIYLELKEENLSNQLDWNAYYQWQGGTEDHYIYRSIDGGEFKEIGSENYSAEYLNHNDYLGELLYNDGEFCYYILAKESNNPHTKNGTSASNIVCIVKEARIFIPNSFNPVSKIQENRVFMPQGSFFNKEDYHFIVWNRFDEVMFESDEYGKAWDGTYKGKAVPEGLYMYKLEVEHHSGKIKKKGTVSVKYNEE